MSASALDPKTAKKSAAHTESAEVWYPLPQRNGDHSCKMWRACSPTTAASEFVPDALSSAGSLVDNERTPSADPHASFRRTQALYQNPTCSRQS